MPVYSIPVCYMPVCHIPRVYVHRAHAEMHERTRSFRVYKRRRMSTSARLSIPCDMSVLSIFSCYAVGEYPDSVGTACSFDPRAFMYEFYVGAEFIEYMEVL